MKKILKKSLIGLVALSTLAGTYLGREADLPPFYSKKTNTSYGINVSLYTKIEQNAKINGLNISLFTNNSGEINGGNIALMTYSNKGHINGLELSVGQNLHDLDALNTLNGVAIGILNNHKQVNGIQIGLYNSTYTPKRKSGVILNIDYNK